MQLEENNNNNNSNSRTNTRNRQILTSFPNSNAKHIDYVIAYKEGNNDDPDKKAEIESMRNAFFEALVNETIDISYIRFEKNEQIQVYALLHCPVERLLKEAEAMKLEMKLKNVKKAHLYR
jgi:hypothetical protein